MVTQFEVIPAAGVKVNRIANLDADLALAMKASSVRIVAPIPGKGAVGVEIPNPQPEIVNLREILETPAFQNAKGELPLALGKDLNGRPYVANLAKMPHVLIAGATGSGKSVCLNTIVTSLVYKHTPETLRLLMIDPKMVELSVYARLPHLRHNVVTDPRDAAGVLKWAVLEMERRYELLKANHVRSIQEFNRKVKDEVVLRRVEPVGPEGDEDRWIYTDGVMPYIVVVVDELADLMMTVQSEVEKPLTQLAQKARAIGIHLIVATQRPSVNVITGLIKANFPTRIAFRVASKTDSRTILDQNGADALLGNGDMLFLPPGQSEPVRVQGAFLPTEDTERLMPWYRELQERHEEAGEPTSTPSVLEPDILEEVRTAELMAVEEAVEEISGDWDELFRAAAEVCIQNQGGSTSLLQRRLEHRLRARGAHRGPAPGRGRARALGGREGPRGAHGSGRAGRPAERGRTMTRHIRTRGPVAVATRAGPGAGGPSGRRRPPASPHWKPLRPATGRASAVCADFMQTLSVPLLGQESHGSGRLCQAQPDLFAMRFADPAGDAVVMDGTYVWIYYTSADPKTVIRLPVADAPGGFDLHREFLDDPARKYEITYEGTEKVGGHETARIRLVPRASASYQSAVVWIDESDHLLRRVKLEEENESVRTLTLSDVTLDPRIPDGWFTFTPPSGVQIISR